MTTPLSVTGASPVRTRRFRRLLTAVLAAVALLLLVPAAPASAHSQLIGSTPANGARLDQPPQRVTLHFSEGINLIDGGIRLLDRHGTEVSTAAPTAQGSTVSWVMPAHLRDGTYLVDWRIISADGHPVSGAFSFGVGADVRAVPQSALGATTGPPVVVATRWLGYLLFALLVGVFAFVTWCSPVSRRDPTLQLLGRVALVGGALATVATLLEQGPYATGAGWNQLFSSHLTAETLSTPFGVAVLYRLLVYVGAFFGVWMLEWLDSVVVQRLVAVALVVGSVTFAAAGHGASSGRLLDLVVDAFHVMAASTWVGGLMVLAVVGRSVERRAVQQFSSLALASVLLLVATGVVNSVVRVRSVDNLFGTRYGLLLLLKLCLVAGALAAAGLSRQRLRRGGSVAESVRIEAVVTVVVLALTAALTLTSPPPSAADTAAGTAGRPGASAPSTAAVELKLLEGGNARVALSPATTASRKGSAVAVAVEDDHGKLVGAPRVRLQVSAPSRNIDKIAVPLARHGLYWTGRYRFPYAGTWKVTLTVQDRSLSAVVTAGNVTIGSS